VYEFGPEDGRKVLFVHGISTSCMTLKDIAQPLADKGCRVMLFVSKDSPKITTGLPGHVFTLYRTYLAEGIPMRPAIWSTTRGSG
jgi:hypothetical protein